MWGRLWISPGSCCSDCRQWWCLLSVGGMQDYWRSALSAKSGEDCGLGATRSWSYPRKWMWDVWQAAQSKVCSSRASFLFTCSLSPPCPCSRTKPPVPSFQRTWWNATSCRALSDIHAPLFPHAPTSHSVYERQSQLWFWASHMKAMFAVKYL